VRLKTVTNLGRNEIVEDRIAMTAEMTLNFSGPNLNDNLDAAIIGLDEPSIELDEGTMYNGTATMGPFGAFRVGSPQLSTATQQCLREKSAIAMHGNLVSSVRAMTQDVPLISISRTTESPQRQYDSVGIMPSDLVRSRTLGKITPIFAREIVRLKETGLS
jgi:hypothetical protein